LTDNRKNFPGREGSQRRFICRQNFNYQAVCIPMPLTYPALAGEFFTTSTTWRAHMEILNRAGGVRFPKAMKETEESRGPSSKTEESVQCPPLQNLRIFRNQNLPHCLRDFYNINYGLD